MADDASAHPDVLNQAAQGQLKSIIERIERLELEKAEVAEQIKENIRRVVGILLEDRATTKIVLSDAVGVDPGVGPGFCNMSAPINHPSRLKVSARAGGRLQPPVA